MNENSAVEKEENRQFWMKYYYKKILSKYSLIEWTIV